MELTTERLNLREFVEDDWKTVLVYQQKPAFLRYYEWEGRSEQDVRDFVSRFIEQQREAPRLRRQLAIELKSTGLHIGSCGIRMDSQDATEGDIGFEIDPAYWGQGYASEAAAEILRFGFEELELHRIWGWCVADNRGSRKVMENLGMKQEARLREKDFFKGRWWDHIVYAILDCEWKERRSR